MFKEFFSDGTNLSATRLIVVFVVLFIVLIVFATWGAISLRQAHLAEFPASLSASVLGLVTSSYGVLHLNKREETKDAALNTK